MSEPLPALYAAARERWPGVDVPLDDFARWVAERPANGEVAGVDLYLACGCARGDAAALGLFDRVMVPRLRPSLRRIDASAAFEDTVWQRLRQQLFTGPQPSIAGYAGTTPLWVWLKVVAVREALRVERERAGRREVELEDEQLQKLASPAADPELTYLKKHYGAAFRAALIDAFRGLHVRDRNLMRQHFLDGLSLERLAELQQVHRATVARSIAGARSQVVRDVTRLLGERSGVPSSAFSSLVRLVRSELRDDLGGIVRESLAAGA